MKWFSYVDSSNHYGGNQGQQKQDGAGIGSRDFNIQGMLIHLRILYKENNSETTL